MDGWLEMYLHDRSGRRIHFADVGSVDDACGLWTEVAGKRGVALDGFTVVKMPECEVVYRGDYVTDEC